MSPLRRSTVAILIVVLASAIGYAVARSKRDFWDFEVYRTAGGRALHAQPLYREDDGHYQFKYWPAFAFAMVPFGLINPEVGKVLWYSASVGLLAVFVRQSVRALPDRRSSEPFLIGWTLLLTGKFIVKELVNGQTNALLGVLIVSSLVSARRGRRGAAGVMLGAAVLVKPYALLFLPWLAVTEGAVAVAGALGVLAAGLCLPALAYGWSGNLGLLSDWYRTVVDTTPANLMLAENISFATMWAKWIGAGPAASAMALATTAAALGAVAVAWWRRRNVVEPGYLEVSLLLLLVPLISPQGWDYVLLLATPAFVCLVDRFREDAVPWRLVTAAGFILASFTIYDLLGRRLYLAMMAGSVVSMGALLLGASLLHLRFRSLA